MDFTKYISENLLILVAVVYILGVFLKLNSKVPDWLIPWILLVLGVGFSIWLTGFTAMAVVQGILIVGAAVLGNQLFKQTMEGLVKPSVPPKEINPTNTTDFRE